MTAWKLKNISDSYKQTDEFRHNNSIVTPHVKSIIGRVEGKCVLDIGCGFGRYLEVFGQDNPLKLVGCDLSVHQIELCKKNVKNINVEYYTLDFTDAKSSAVIGQEKYDVVYNVFVVLYIETLDKLQRFMENCYRCLKKEGKLLICTLDMARASLYPEVFKILNFPVKSLTEDGTYRDGCPVEITITEECIVTSYHREFETFKKVMKNIGFQNIKRHDIFLDDLALQSFAKEELEIYKKSNILLLIEAYK